MTKSKKSTKLKEPEKSIWPTVIQGSHSTRIEHSDGRVDFITNWEALERDIREAIAGLEHGKSTTKQQAKTPITKKPAAKKPTKKKK